MATKGTNRQRVGNEANLGFEAQFWSSADTLRNNMNAAESPDLKTGHVHANPPFDQSDSRGTGPLGHGF
jgi:hypothetical protein